MSDKVSFTAMEHASRADYDLVFEHDTENMRGQAARVIEWLKMMDELPLSGESFGALFADDDPSSARWCG